MSTRFASRRRPTLPRPAQAATLARLIRTAALAVGAALTIVAAAAASPECPNAENLVSNCGFETNVTGWTVEYGDSFVQDADAHSGLWSGLVDAEIGKFSAAANIETCIHDVDTDRPYEFGGWAKLEYDGAVNFNCLIYVVEFGTSVNPCGGTEGGESNTGFDVPDGSTFMPARVEYRPPAGVEDVRFGVVCNNPDLVDFLFYVDDLFFTFDHTIFADSFDKRTGDSCEWSDSIGGGC